MNHILYTKNFQAKTIRLLFVLTFFFSCSPTVYILDHKPKFGGQLYKNNVVSKTQNKIKNSADNPALLKNGVEELTTYAFGFLMEESDRAMLDNYSKAKELESQAHQYTVILHLIFCMRIIQTGLVIIAVILFSLLTLKTLDFFIGQLLLTEVRSVPVAETLHG